jgi:hypothetical protein
MWPLLIQAGISLLSYALPRLLAVGGVVAVSETVIQPAFDFLQSKIMSNFSGLPADVVNFLNFLGFTDAVGIVFTAYITALGIKAGKAAFAKSGAKRV